jgi:hypothetical protein
MKIDRNKFAEELKLRQFIREAIQIVKKRHKKVEKQQFLQENRLRGVIRDLILQEASVPDPDEAPHSSTGINILEDLLKKIIPIIEIDFKKLTTSEEQRSSYRSHMVQGVKNLLAPAIATDKAALQGGEEFEAEEEITAITEVEIAVDPENVHTDTPDEFIDIGGDKKEKKTEAETEKEEFTIEGEDETGRDMSFSTFKKIQGSILDSWEVLSNDEDKELFYDYLLTNLKLYFDKFGDELKTTLPEPTTPEYDEAAAETAEGGAEEEIAL